MGFTEDGHPARTVLALMVKSLFGKYKDVECLIPVTKMDTVLLRKMYDQVMQDLNESAHVVAACQQTTMFTTISFSLNYVMGKPMRISEHRVSSTRHRVSDIGSCLQNC